MARNFVAASTQYLKQNSTIATALPLTMACWFRTTDVASAQPFIDLDDSGAAGNHRFTLGVNTNQIRGSVFDSVGGGDTVTATGTYTSGVWTHAAVVFTGAASRAAYRDGVNKVSSVAAVDGFDAPLNTTLVGATYTAGVLSAYMNGDIGEGAVWSVALVDAEVAALGQGVSPLLIRPTALISYWPLIGVNSPETDAMVKGANLTLTNTPIQATSHPPMIYPVGSFYTMGGSGVIAPTPASPITLPLSSPWFLHRFDLKPRAEEHA